MKHGRKIVKLQRKQDHRDALLMNLTCSLIEHRRIRTTLAKAKALRPYAEKLVTLGKRGTLHARRTALSSLRHKDMVKKLKLSMMSRRMRKAVPMAPPIATERTSFFTKRIFCYSSSLLRLAGVTGLRAMGRTGSPRRDCPGTGRERRP